VASAHMKAAAKRDTYRDIGALSPCLQSFFIAADYTPARVKTQRHARACKNDKAEPGRCPSSA